MALWTEFIIDDDKLYEDEVVILDEDEDNEDLSWEEEDDLNTLKI